MPKMSEIYKKYAEDYDKLVQAEDYKQILKNYLKNNFNWNKRIIYEAGIGTGRLTDIFIKEVEKVYGFDKEAHMLERCQYNLKKHKEKIILNVGENEDLPLIEEKADIFIEGWSFGHTIVENGNNIAGITENILNKINRITAVDGEIILIETLGTHVNKPKINNVELTEFYNLLEKEYGFKKSIVRTDYKFNDYREASQVIGFFFGEEMGNKVLKSKSKFVEEYTGIWRKSKGKIRT
jgi:precorrin-6B methylase 2